MIRSLYAALLRLHPRRFRERFSEEMLGIFDEQTQTASRISLLLDGAVSLFRQHALRQPPSPTPPADRLMFRAVETALPRTSALMHGAAISLLLFSAATFALGRAGGSFPKLLIGAKHARPNVLPVDRNSIQEADPTAEIKVPRPAASPIIDAYFNIIRVLDILDANQDRVLSLREIDNAPSRLAKIDANGDSKLSAEECGFSLGARDLDEELVAQLRHRFMSFHPALAALNTDGDWEISRFEILASPRNLRTLDKDRDGSLTPPELFPASMLITKPPQQEAKRLP